MYNEKRALFSELKINTDYYLRFLHAGELIHIIFHLRSVGVYKNIGIACMNILYRL